MGGSLSLDVWFGPVTTGELLAKLDELREVGLGVFNEHLGHLLIVRDDDNYLCRAYTLLLPQGNRVVGALLKVALHPGFFLRFLRSLEVDDAGLAPPDPGEVHAAGCFEAVAPQLGFHTERSGTVRLELGHDLLG